MEFADRLKKDWVKAKLEMTMLKQKTNSPHDSGQLVGHKQNKISRGVLL